ncbi:MAG TPA: hypothetical protein VGO93_30895, partial [Candidatus Xenobia bacterium]
VKNDRKLPLSVQLWNMFAGKRAGLITPYAGTNPQEYFAECVEAWFSPEGRQRLQAVDPQMDDYLTTLFAA